MALQIGGVSLSGLDASKDPAAVFPALATAYRFDEKIAKHLVETVGLDNLLDFVHVVTCEGEWEPIIARVPDLEQRAGQLSRVRQAWKAVRDSAQEAENRKKRGLDESDDATLPAQQLVVLSVTFHARYKLSFPAAWEPSELLISKINRELSKRQLTVISVWKVRSIVCAAKAPRKRQKVGDVEILSGEREDPDHTKDLKTYIALHLVLMVGYARAGIRAVEPIPSEPEKSSSDPTDYVEVSMCLAARQGGLARAWRRARRSHWTRRWHTITGWLLWPMHSRTRVHCTSFHAGTRRSVRGGRTGSAPARLTSGRSSARAYRPARSCGARRRRQSLPRLRDPRRVTALGLEAAVAAVAAAATVRNLGTSSRMEPWCAGNLTWGSVQSHAPEGTNTCATL